MVFIPFHDPYRVMPLQFVEWYNFMSLWTILHQEINAIPCKNWLRSWVLRISHDDVIKWKHFPRYWPFVRGIHRSPVNSPHKGQWRGALMFSLICAWINGWVNNREAGYLRRHRAHCDVIVMNKRYNTNTRMSRSVFSIPESLPYVAIPGLTVICSVLIILVEKGHPKRYSFPLLGLFCDYNWT